jgi:hypothetical protein
MRKYAYIIAAAAAVALFALFSHVYFRKSVSNEPYKKITPGKKIEIFDIDKGYVVKEIEFNPVIQEEVVNLLGGITNIYVRLNPIPKKGYMAKIPLEPDIMIQNQWLRSLVSQVIFVFPEKEEPYLLIIDDNNKLHAFYFEGSTEVLLKNLKYLPD